MKKKMKNTEIDMKHYHHLLIMALLSFVAMYLLMYSMVNVLGNVFMSLNQFYMAGLMTAPMVLIELAVMRAMFMDRSLNTIIVAVSLIAGLMFFVFIRQQVAISDRQFLRSMISHHAGAILMCERAQLDDPENQALCQTIISNQQAEIDQMKARLQASDQ
jgi:hypothetical protein